MPDTKPVSPARLAEIERILCSNATWWREHAVELVAEVRRLQSAVDRLANAERDLAETGLVLEQQDRDLESLRASNVDAMNEVMTQADRIAALETGLREALGRWEYPNPTHADKARKDELWRLLQDDNATKETK